MFKNMTKTKLIYYGVFISLLGILIGSVSHLSYTFFTLEEKESMGFVSFTISAGIEAGMLAIAFGIAERRRAGRRFFDLLFYQVFFASVNFYGNLYFAISVFTGQRNLTIQHIVGVDPLILFTACFLSGSLPILALSLSELQSIFGLRVKQEDKQEERRISKEKEDKIKEERRESRKKEREELMKNFSPSDRVILEKAVKDLDDEEAEDDREDEEDEETGDEKKFSSPDQKTEAELERIREEKRHRREERRKKRKEALEKKNSPESETGNSREEEKTKNSDTQITRRLPRIEDQSSKLVEGLTSSGDFQSEALKQFPVDVFDGNNRRRIPLKDD